jgi:hypothetical protein
MHMPGPHFTDSRKISKRWFLFGGAIAFLLILIGLIIVDYRATAWIESPRFQDLLDRETSKGMHFKANFPPLRRVGQLGMETDSFTGTDGQKTIVSLQAQHITGVFNPLGFFLQRWEIDSAHIDSGTVMLQKTEPTPGAPKGVPWRPWWGYFWPYRVHLADIKVDDAKILWKLNDKESGIYDTFLEVTPNGRDFEYDARGGAFATPMTPTLTVLHTHLLVRKPRLYCSEFLLGDDPAHPEHYIRAEGDAGLQDDRSMRLGVDIVGMKVAPWLPEKVRPHVTGEMNGRFDYKSTGTGLETGEGVGKLELAHVVLRNLPQIKQYVALTGSPDPGDMPLKVGHADIAWKAGAVTVSNLEAESEGVFRVTGTVTMAKDKTMSGVIELGLTAPYLKWLPTAESAIFTREDGPYHFATIHISGTSQKPKEDLSPRVAKEVEKSPLLALKLFFNQAGEWFNFN